jgi:hypothetical protein
LTSGSSSLGAALATEEKALAAFLGKYGYNKYGYLVVFT